MTQREIRSAIGGLEGLVLGDGTGAFYEVPTMVIARYRLADDEVVRLRLAGQLSGADEPQRPAWTVHSGVYAPLTAPPPSLDGGTPNE
jgi:hypothetical protein